MNHQSMVKYIKEGLLNLIFPLDCKICEKPIRESKGYSICEDCFKDIKLIDRPYCVKCGKPFLISTDLFKQDREILCVDCKRKKYSFEFARSIGVYLGILKECIHLFKYYGEKKLAEPFGKLLIDYLIKNQEFKKGIDLIVPVPLHKNDLKRRGFNQSILLSRTIGNYFSIPVEEILIKKKLTSSQVNLSKKEREKNILRAFSIERIEEIKDKNVLILDDIFTTGSTVEECARELKKAKARNIFVLTLARSV